jgi:hypothetical protein
MEIARDIAWTWGPLVLIIATWAFFGWYFGQKVARAKAAATGPSAGPPDTLTMVRAIDGTNYLRAFSVLIDGIKVGSIRAGEAKHFEIAPGVHSVAVRVDFLTSREFTIHQRQGDNQRLNCGSTYNDWRCIFMWMLKPRDYVYVRAQV